MSAVVNSRAMVRSGGRTEKHGGGVRDGLSSGRRSRPRRTSWVVLLGAVAVFASTLIVGSSASDVVHAAGTPDITLTKTADARTLIGSNTAVSLRACNPSGPGNGFNLSFRDVVPAGFAVAAASPAPSRVVVDQPAVGETTLIWENVSDLLLGACSQVTYQLDTNADGNLATNPVGSTFGTTAGAYVSSDAFTIPDFDAAGQPSGDFTGFDTDGPTTTTIAAFIVEKSAPGAGEAELLRGVHGAEPTVYTLRVRNNPESATNSFTVVDVLPANLEFLGCESYTAAGYDAGADNTVDAVTNELAGNQVDEYPGSGRLAIGPALAGCFEPSSVETLSTGETRVTWSSAALGVAANLAAAGVLEVRYLAGIPLRSNTDVWANGKPSDASLGQGRNLDNNTGAPTSETATEPTVTNTATATGTFQGPSTTGFNPTLSDTDVETLTSEDVVIRKSTTGTVIQGTVVTTVLTVQTGEYRDTQALSITDTLPDGLCPLASVALSGDADCGTGADPTIDTGGGPVAAPFTSATENADGTWTLVWDASTVPGLTALAASSSLAITFQSRVRSHYQDGFAPAQPVLNFDTITNNVAMQALDFRRGVIDAVTGDPEPDGQLDFDTSSATIAGVGPSIDKRVSSYSGALAAGSGVADGTVGDICRDGVGITWAQGDPTPVAGYGPGDYICFDLQATFPSDIDAAGVNIQDLLPPAYDYVAGSARRVTGGTAPDTLPATTVSAQPAGTADIVTFNVQGTGAVPASPTGHRFHWTIAAKLTDPAAAAAADIVANLMKMTTRNSGGEVFQFRDQAAGVWTEPQVKLDKSNDATGPLDAGDDVVYTVRVWNDGNATARNVVVWDRLPAGITCADVVTSTPAATCGSNILVWDAADIPTIAAGTSLATAISLTYTVDLPASVDPGRAYTNTAGVRQYEASVNGADPFTYFPSSNIDPSVTSPNTGAAHDTSTITIRAATVAKVQQSGVNETGNTGNIAPATTAEQVTIGETITYTVTATIPEGTSVIDARFEDALDADLELAATPTWVFAGVPNDPSWTIHASTPAIGGTGTIRLDRAGTYTNAAGSGDDTLVVTIVARVRNVGATAIADTTPNTGTFSWLPDNVVGTTRSSVTSNSVTATVREPSITLAKDENDTDDIVAPNDSLTYTLTVGAASGTNRSAAHDLVVVDTIPAGITVVNGGVPVADGGAVNPDGGIWNQGARTITWNTTTTAGKLTTISPGSNTTLSYAVVVDDPAVSGSVFTNNVTASATSMPGVVAGERTTYSANATDTVTAPLASIAKSVSPSQATVGDTVTFSVDATVPAGVTAWDLTVLDTLPDGLDFRAFGTFTYTGTSTNCPSLAGAQGIAGQTANGDGSTMVGFFVDDFVAPSSNPCTIRMTYTARVDDLYVPENTPVSAGQTLVNSARVYWNSLNSVSSVPATPPAPGGYTRNAGPATATVTVREPVVVIDKDVSQAPCDATPGNTGDNDICNTDVTGTAYTYTLTIRNTSATWPAHDISVVDAPDADLVNLTVPPSSGVITVVDGTAPNLEWLISTIPANGTVTITYTAELAASASLNDGETIVNTADVPTYFAQPVATRTGDPSADWRTYGQGGAGGDDTADTVTMTVGFPHVTVVKTALDDATDARVGEPFTWRIVATNNATEPTAAAFGVDVDDILPTGWVYQTGSTSIVTPYGTVTTDPVCTPDCATPGATLQWTNLVSGGGQPLNPGANITITFDATPQASLLTVGTTGTFAHTNTAGVDADDARGATGNADGPYVGPDSSAVARIRQTDLSVTKVPSAGPYSFGSDVNWTITVTNAGPDTATGVTVQDLLPIGLFYVNQVSATQGSFNSGTGTWTVGTLTSGTTATLVIRTRINQIGTITNRAEVQTSNQWDVDSTPNSVTAVADEDDDDTASIVAVSTGLGDYVWYDIDGDGTADAGEPGIPGVRVLLESEGLDNTFGTADDFWGPDGVSGGGDDITVTELVTNGTGFYGFSNLPTGDYRVAIDVSTLPAGMVQSYDDGGPLDDRSGIVTLNSSAGYLGADFGYTGNGSLGDLVWLDIDATGGATQGPGEPGLEGIDVTLVWGGFDGDLSTIADNITYPIDTTDAAGAYGFTRLPAGPYRVTVDAADLPAGTTPTYDLDATATPHVAITSLSSGQTRTDVDFSVTGTGSIGDRVWLDRDNDGVFDNDEAGLSGIDITVVWHGPDGVPGGGDDVTYTTTTDTTGTYLVDALPAGSYSVTIDSNDLPPGVEPTHDLDGTATAHTSAVTLGAGQDRTDADFGYRGLASVGDRVWFDIDGDGASAPETGEIGLAGVTVTVTWAGMDGALGTADDVDFTTTTDATGTYLVDALPYGPVRVSVDRDDLAGFEPTFDGDNHATPDVVVIVLAADDAGTTTIDEANRRDADFAYTGTGSIGDLVWEDLDADRTRNGTETGIDGVDVTVTWVGLDGTAGTADDVTWTVTTAGGGAYVIDRLPAGAFIVSIDPADLPTGSASTHDVDGIGTVRTSTVPLNPGQDRSDVDFGERPQADLSIDKSHTGSFEVGRNGVYTLAVRNAGPATALTPTVQDVLPAGLSYISATTTGGACGATGQTVRCDLSTMAPNTTTTITLTVSVGVAAAPGVVNTATAASPTADPAPGNNTDSDPTDVPVADIQITKTLDGALVRNSVATYILEATNRGPSVSGGPVVITDDLPPGLTFVEAAGVGATCTATGQLVTCRTPAALAVGQIARIELRVRVTAAPGTPIANTANVVTEATPGIPVPFDPTPDNNNTTTPATPVVPANLPSTGATVARWLQLATLAISLGWLTVRFSRRRRLAP